MTLHQLVPFIPWIGGLIALGCLLGGLRNLVRKRLVEATPTSKVKGVFIGLVEVKGNAESEKPFTSYLAGAPCVYYAWKVEEEWSKTETDKDGKTSTSSGWKTVGEGGESGPFYVKDSSGALLVHPRGARLDPEVAVNRMVGPSDAMYYGKGPAGSISNSTHRRSFTEKIFRLHAPLFIVGKARQRRDMVAPEVAQDDGAELFMISARTEKEVVGSFRWAGRLWNLAGLAAIVGGLVLLDWLHGLDLKARVPVYAQAGAAYLGAVALGWVWSVFNSLVSLRNRVNQARALIDVQLKRRHDLIPNLVRLVGALNDHERLVQAQLAALRGQVNATPQGQPGPDYAGSRGTLAVLAEQYPELKANKAFLELQRELTDTEYRIALARDYYNSIATHLNTRLEEVPDRFIALLGAFQRQDLFAAEGFEREAVKVSFAP